MRPIFSLLSACALQKTFSSPKSKSFFLFTLLGLLSVAEAWAEGSHFTVIETRNSLRACGIRPGWSGARCGVWPSDKDALSFDLLTNPIGESLINPLAITSWRERVILVAANQVVEINPDSREQRVLLEDPELRNPIAIAASFSGRIAIVDDSRLRLMMFDRLKDRLQLVSELDLSFRPDWIDFDGETLLLLRTGSSQLLSVSDRGKKVELTSTSYPVGGIQAFAIHNGLHHVFNGSDITILETARSPSGDGVYTYPAPEIFRGVTTFEVTSRYVICGSSEGLQRVERQLPVDFSFQDEQGNNAPALASLYSALLERSTLRVRDVTSTREQTIESLLIAEQCWIPSTPIDPAAARKITEARELMSRVICKLNGSLCSTTLEFSTSLDRPIGPGQRLRIPSWRLRSVSTSSEVEDSSITVAQALHARVPIVERRTEAAGKLWQLNARNVQSAPGVILGLGFIPATPPRSDLEVGDRVQYLNGIEWIQPGTDCSSSGPIAKGPSIPSQLVSPFWPAFLPVVGNVNLNLAHLYQRKAARLEVSFENTEYIASEGSNDCGRPPGETVAEVIRARRGTFRVLRADGVPVELSQSDLTTAGIRGTVHPSLEGTFVIEEPFTIGYRLANTDSQFKWMDQLSSNKPRFDLFDVPAAGITVPIIHWSFVALVKATDLPTIIGLRSVHSGFGVSARERVVRGSAALDMPQANLSACDLIRDRERMLRQIKYDQPPAGVDLMGVGVMEHGSSIDFTNPAFHDSQGRSRWWTWTGEGFRRYESENSGTAASELQDPCGAAADGQRPPPSIRDDLSELDLKRTHGTSVAGILAAREKDLAPGLLPKLGALFLIDSETTALDITSAMRAAANDNRVWVFNISAETLSSDDEIDDLALKELKDAMRKLKHAFFVVSAGNDNKDVSAEVRGLIGWMHDMPNNMIGVGSVRSDGLRSEFSNYGRGYLQILAPGTDVYAPAFMGEYARISGTSFAAPQVTAAAASLATHTIVQPRRIKARLFYTSHWTPNLSPESWGGVLDFRRATFEPNHNVLEFGGNTYRIYLSATDERKLRFVGGLELDARDVAEDATPAFDTIPTRDILRIQKLPENLYRVVYLRDSFVRSRTATSILGTLRCEKSEVWNVATKQFNAVQSDLCPNGFPVAQITDYVAQTPTASIKF